MEGIPSCIDAVTAEIVARIHPKAIILFSHKRSPKDATSSFKLCVVAETADPRALERSLYLDVDCEVPFDLLLYTPAQWETLLAQPGSFARQVWENGQVLHG